MTNYFVLCRWHLQLSLQTAPALEKVCGEICCPKTIRVDQGSEFVSRDLDLTPSSLGNWVRHAQADRTKGKTGLTTEERTELSTLRKENRELRMERDILKKAAAFFAKNQA